MSGIFGKKGQSSTDPRLNAIQINRSAYGAAIPLVYGKQRLAGTLMWYGDFNATAHTQNYGKGGGGGSSTTYTYTASIMLALCEGAITSTPTIFYDQGQDTNLPNYNLTLFTGGSGQTPWSYLTTNHSSQAIGYDHTAYVAGANFNLGSSAALPNLSFETVALLSNATYNGDAAPAAILADYCTDPNHGAGFPYLSTITGSNSYDTYCQAMGFFLSPMETSQRAAADFIKELLQATNSEAVWSANTLKIIPYADTSVTGNGVTYTPGNGNGGAITTPIYSFSDDDYIDQDQPVEIIRKPQSLTYNDVRVEYLNRSNQYNTDIAESSDAQDVALNGVRLAPSVTLHCVTQPTVARTVAQLILQRQLYYRNQIQFKVRADYSLLEPMDVVSITDTRINLNNQLARVIEVQDDGNDELTIICEELPLGPGNTPAYYWNGASGYFANTLTTPGSVSAPAMFMVPPSLVSAQGGYQLAIAVGGASQYWGGCDVYMSLDNTTFEKVGTMSGAARYGTLTASMASNSADPDTTSSLAISLVNTTQTISAGSQSDVDNFRTLMYVDGEIIAYRDATLTSTGNYTLGYFHRGLYGSSVAAHSSGASWARIDSQLFRLPLDPGLAGQTVYLKFVSFNVWGKSYESLANVTSYSKTIPAASATAIAASPFTARTSCVVNGTSIYKSTAGTTAWDSDCYTTAAYSSGAALSFTAGQNNKALMMALNANPATDQTYSSLAYAWYLTNAGVAQIYESGTQVTLNLAYAANDVFQIHYDGVSVSYWKNGVIYRTVTNVTGKTLAMDSSFYDPGATVLNVNFGPSTSLNNTSVLNSQIVIGSNGLLTGAGGGQVTLPGLGAGSLATLSSANLDTNVTDGSTYLRMPSANMDGNRRALIDFTQSGHTGKTLDNVADGSSRFGVTNGAGLKAVSSVDANNKALIDFTQSGHTGKTLDNVADGAARFSVTNGAGLKAVSSVDSNNKALIDFTQAGHTGKTVDNIGDGTTYARPLATALTSGQIDLSKGGVINKILGNIADSPGRYAVTNFGGNAVASVDSNNLALIDFSQAGHSNKTLDNVGDGTTYARVSATALTSGAVDMSKAGVTNKGPYTNANITIGSNGSLSGGGGGQVTIGGLGYSGDLNATWGAPVGTNVGGYSAAAIGPIAQSTNVAYMKPTTASSGSTIYGAGPTAPVNTNAGVYSIWSCPNSSLPQYFTIDLGVSQPQLNSIVLYSAYPNDNRQLPASGTVSLSTDNSTYTQVASWSGVTGDPIVLSLGTQQARYIRVTATGAPANPSGSTVTQLSNVRVYSAFGSPSNSMDTDVIDGSNYGRPLASRLNGGKPWIDFSESIHANKGALATQNAVGWNSSYLTGTPSNLAALSGSEAIQNSQITISAGTIQGIGSGYGTVVDNTYTLIGQNLVPNSDQSQKQTWFSTYNPNGATIDDGPRLANTQGSWNTSNYVLVGTETNNVYLHQAGIATGTVDGSGDTAVAVDIGLTGSGAVQFLVPCVPGDTFIGSAYIASHRCNTAVFLAFYDSSGNAVAYPFGASTGPTNTLTNVLSTPYYNRQYVKYVAPANAAQVSLRVRKWNTLAGNTDSYMWVAAPMLEKVNSNVSTPSPYQPGPVSSTRQLAYTGDLNATYGAAWASNLTGTPQNLSTLGGSETIVQGNFLATYGANPTFVNWTSTFPAGWSSWTGSYPTKSTTYGGGVPYTVTWTIQSSDVSGGGDGMYAQMNFPNTPLPAGTFFTGSYAVQMLSGTTYATIGYLVRLFTNSALTTYVDNFVIVPNQSAGGWQHVPITATAGGSAIYGVTLYQMAGWSLLIYGSSGMPAAGVSMTFGPISLYPNLPIGTSQAQAGLINGNITLSSAGVLSGAGGGSISYDSLPDGSTYFKVKGSALTSGNIDPSKSGVLATGSIPPAVPTGTFSATTTTTSITLSWSAFSVYRADGTTVSISSGSQTITGLTANTGYKYYPYVADSGGTSGTVAWVAGGTGSPAYAQNTSTGNLALAAATMAARGNIPLGAFAVNQPASGTGTGGGGGSGCLHPDTYVTLADGRTLRASALTVGDTLPVPGGESPITNIVRRPCGQWIRVYTSRSPLSSTVTLDHVFYRATGESVKAEDLRLGDLISTFGDHAEVLEMSLIYDTAEMVSIDVLDPHQYYLGDGGLLSHNGTLKP